MLANRICCNASRWSLTRPNIQTARNRLQRLDQSEYELAETQSMVARTHSEMVYHFGGMKPRGVSGPTLRKTIRRGSAVTRRSNLLDGRPGFQLQSSWGHIAVLEGGGHICELMLNSLGSINPMWKPTWKTIDPPAYNPRKHRNLYGPPTEGRLLAGIAGHSISFDFFGPPSREEIAAGHSTHGEAPVMKWHRQSTASAAMPSLIYGADLPQARMSLRRAITLDPETPVVYCEETASNLGSFDRPISWNHHITFGPPFLESEITTFDMPAIHSQVCAATFSEHMLLRPDSFFQWPDAPMKDGGTLNLRRSAKGRYSHYTAHLLDPEIERSFIAVSNPRLRLLVVYIFNRRDYPWVGNWEESYSRVHTPWKGREFCRGFEFSTTPFPIPRRETVTNGNMFGESTYIWLPAKSQKTCRYMILMLQVPQNFEGVAAVEIDHDSMLVHERSTRSIIETHAKPFL